MHPSARGGYLRPIIRNELQALSPFSCTNLLCPTEAGKQSEVTYFHRFLMVAKLLRGEKNSFPVFCS